MGKKLYSLTRPQKSIWLTEQYYPNSNINNVCGVMSIFQAIDFDALKKESKKYEATITQYLTAVLIHSIYEEKCWIIYS